MPAADVAQGLKLDLEYSDWHCLLLPETQQQ